MLKAVRLILWLLVAVLAGALGWVTYDIANREAPVKAAEGPFGVPFTLVSGQGGAVTRDAFLGKPTLLFFGFTHCPEVCPTTLFEMNGWLKQVDPEARKLQAFFVTVDPERDTPELLGRYIANVSDRVTGLSGSPDAVMAMVKGFRVYARKVPVDAAKPDGDYTMDHTASVFLLDAEGRFRGTIAYGENPETAVKKLENLAAG
ncbi:cytochrome c oxidase assembly protein [Xaviernesmea oryzae]|uniref:Cytochrome c oxidase assembly protein n=1 Tax=Xaviernesmea oryzae TaxID=464029 RepID=A0A1Q9B013_9HYPH|nr:SCO family protein [Xaviernesmea oryzae]OLP61319.1 cytochrome c oxidase assembly protein [Xaviernesmea oryzae]SEL54892.1 protein SCO1/2 [Xaviernesmea oryzae]